MSQRVAELMAEADGARTAAARREAAEQAQALILELWQSRPRWSHRWPPMSAQRICDALDGVGRSRTLPSKRPRRTWKGNVSELTSLLDRELDLYRAGLMQEVNIAEVQGWLDESVDGLDAEDRAMLDGIVRAERRAARQIELLMDQPRAQGSGTEEQQTKALMAELQKIAKRRAELLREIRDASEARRQRRGAK